MSRSLSEPAARKLLAPLRTTPPEPSGALDDLLAALPSHRENRRRVLVVSLAVTAVCIVVAALAANRSGHDLVEHSPVQAITSAAHPPSTQSPQPSPTVERVSGTRPALRQPVSLVDVDGLLVESSYVAKKTEILDLRTGSTTSAVHPDGLLLAASDGRIFTLDGVNGTVTSQSARGSDRVSRKRSAFNIAAASGAEAGLWVVSCCDNSASAPGQRIQRQDPSTLATIGPMIDIAAAGQGGHLAAGAGGVWFLPEVGDTLYRVDGSTNGRPTDTFLTAKLDPETADDPETRETIDNGNTLAVGTLGPVFVTDSGRVTSLNAATRKVTQGPPLPENPVALAVSSTSIFVALADRVETFDAATLRQTSTYEIPGVTALSVGIDGVWAASDGIVAQLSTKQ